MQPSRRDEGIAKDMKGSGKEEEDEEEVEGM